MSAPPGVHRGVCVENRDPDGMGRIRVQVPVILGPGVSGWAFPAWTGDDTQVWPLDRLPDPGEGVWVHFESNDRMTWTAVFGPLRHPLDDTADLYVTTLSLALTVLPEDVEIDIAGVLTSKAGTPNPDPVVWLEKSQDKSAWERVDSSGVELDGTFKLQYRRPIGESGWWYRAVFDGLGPFNANSTEPVQSRNSGTVLTWNAAQPIWQTPVTYSGTMAAGSGAAMTGKLVGIWIRQGTVWSKVATAGVLANGTWTTTWTQPKAVTGAIGMRAYFEGDEVYDLYVTPVVEWPAVAVPVVINWSIPAMSFGVQKTITGNITSAYGVPEPDRTVEFQQKPFGSTWSTPVRPVPAADGTFSFVYAANAGICEYKMHFPGSGVYLVGDSSISSQQNSVTTTVSATTVEINLYYGTSHVVSGTVTDQSGALVKYGQVTVEQSRSDVSGGAWTPVVTVNVGSNGAWSGTVPAPNYVGPVSYRGKYLQSSDGFYLTSTGPGTARTVGLRGMGGLSKNNGNLSFSSAYSSWSAVTGATQYEIYHRGQPSGGFGYWTTTTGLAFSHGGLGLDSYHEYIVYPMRQQAGGAWTYGAASAAVAMNTGHPEVRKSGSFGYETHPTSTGSWRPETGWGYVGDKVAQGYYSATNRNYTGVLDYDEDAFMNWVAGNWGWDVVWNLNFTRAQVAMYRVSGVGTGNPVGVWWYVSGSYPNGPAPPSLAGGEARGSLTPGAAAWVDLPYPHWAKHVLLRENIGGNVGTVYSLATYRYNSGEYCQWHGASAGGNVCNLYVECNWNFVTVNQQNPYWY